MSDLNERVMLFEPGDRVRLRADVKSGHAGHEFVIAAVEKGFLRTVKNGITHRFPLNWAEPLDSISNLIPQVGSLIPQVNGFLGSTSVDIEPETLAPSTCGIKKWASVNQYPSHGFSYYRFAWGEGSKTLGQRHIPGGCVQDPQAIANARQVEQWMLEGCSPDAIASKIGDSLQKGKRGRKPF